MPLTLDSPRFSLRNARLADIESAISEVGHAVLDDVWSAPFLSDLHALAEQRYTAADQKFHGKKLDINDGETRAYLGGSDALQYLTWKDGQSVEASFFQEFERSGLPALLRVLFSGDFVVGRTEQVLRRFAPTIMPLSFVMLHTDYQFGACADESYSKKRAVTVWTPFQPCTDDSISRLVFLHKGETYKDLFTEDEIRLSNTDDYLKRDKVDPFFQRVYDNKQCYVPHVPLGSSLIFDHTTLHGTYRLAGMDRNRYSMDFRAVAKYRRTSANEFMKGVLYRNASYPPPNARERMTFWKLPGFRAAVKPIVKPILDRLSRKAGTAA